MSLSRNHVTHNARKRYNGDRTRVRTKLENLVTDVGSNITATTYVENQQLPISSASAQWFQTY
eukprot:5072351-Pleurochrysis_carterae.AAC.4